MSTKTAASSGDRFAGNEEGGAKDRAANSMEAKVRQQKAKRKGGLAEADAGGGGSAAGLFEGDHARSTWAPPL